MMYMNLGENKLSSDYEQVLIKMFWFDYIKPFYSALKQLAQFTQEFSGRVGIKITTFSSSDF